MIPIIGAALDLVDGAIDKIWPDKNLKIQSDAESEKFKLSVKKDMQLMMIKSAMTTDKGLFADVQGARAMYEKELEQKNTPWIGRALRSVFRPVVGFFCFGVWGYTIIQPIITGAPGIELTIYDYAIILSVVAFYFGGRTIEKLFKKA